MITPIQTPWEPNVWRNCLRDALRSSHALLDFLGLPAADAQDKTNFPVLVPRGFAARMHQDRLDPLLRQVLEDPQENHATPGFVVDPLHEAEGISPAPGLIQKYPNRALLIATSGCAINCRYCFRRHFPYAEHRQQNHQAALDYLARQPQIHEIILSGGDPLLLDDNALTRLLDALAEIPHLQRLRIHTRIPIVLPERVTHGLLSLMANTRFQPIIVLHSNHAQELDANTARALSTLQASGVWLLNQAVLLRGVNDSLEVQCNLAQKLFSQGVLPYYLHLPDRVAGTQHFFIDAEEAKQLHKQMQASLPGYLVPRLVQEVPGAAAKVIVSG